MNFNKELRFLGLLGSVAFLLAALSFDDSRVAMLRWQQTAQLDQKLIAFVATNCSQLIAAKDDPFEKFFVSAFSAKSARRENPSRCLVEAETIQSHRFFLKSHWSFALRLRPILELPTFSGFYHAEFPRPLCLLPMVALLLGMIFRLSLPMLGGILALQLAFLSELNLIQAFQMVRQAAIQVLLFDPTFVGLVAVALWFTLLRNHEGDKLTSKVPQTELGRWWNRVFFTLAGLGSPILYSVLARLWYPTYIPIKKLFRLLNFQVVFFALSLYFLSVDSNNFFTLMAENLSLPRYITFSLLFLFVLSEGRSPRSVHRKIPTPRVLYGFAIAGILELLALRFPPLRFGNSLSRIGIALLACELCYPRRINIRTWAKSSVPLVAVTFMGCLIPFIHFDTGLPQLAFALFDPRLHPNAQVFFHFLSGLTVGFFSGNPSLSLSALFDSLATLNDQPLARAAVVDGVLAGTLLCPISLYNLLLCAGRLAPLSELMRARIRQLATPIAIGMAVYLAGVLQSVQILRPLVFVFLLLVLIASQLRRGSWQISRSTFWLNARNDPS